MSHGSLTANTPTDKTVTFYYVRHGKTEFNRDHIIQGGSVDSALVDEYKYLIHNTADALKNIRFNACWCSPLKRAQDTARLVLRDQNVPLQLTEDLREFDFGSLDGTPYEEHRFAFLSSYLMQDFSRFGGETAAQVRARILRVFKHMYHEACDGDKILVEAHRAIVRYQVWEYMEGSYLTRAWESRTVKTSNAAVGLIQAHNDSFTLLTTPLCAEKFKEMFPRYLR